MRLSRGCYDKYHRCPGWAGGGLRYTSVHRCDNGRLRIDYDSRGWRWRFHRCDTCDVLVLPYLSRWADPTWLVSEVQSFFRYRVWDWWQALKSKNSPTGDEH